MLPFVDMLSTSLKPLSEVFANGAAGDISTRFTRASQDYAEVERVGAELASAALTALEHARSVPPGIDSARGSVTLEPRSLEVAAGLEPGALVADRSVAERRKAETQVQGAMLLDRLSKARLEAVQRTVELPAWKLGDVRVVAIPGELFASLGARIAQEASGPTLVLGYANGYVGYLVDDAAEAAGTCEALASPFAPGAGEIVVQEATSLVSQM